MGSVRISVNFIVEEVYEYEVDGPTDWLAREEELIQQARDELLSDFSLSDWQGEWATDYINDDDVGEDPEDDDDDD